MFDEVGGAQLLSLGTVVSPGKGLATSNRAHQPDEEINKHMMNVLIMNTVDLILQRPCVLFCSVLCCYVVNSLLCVCSSAVVCCVFGCRQTGLIG